MFDNQLLTGQIVKLESDLGAARTSNTELLSSNGTLASQLEAARSEAAELTQQVAALQGGACCRCACYNATGSMLTNAAVSTAEERAKLEEELQAAQAHSSEVKAQLEAVTEQHSSLNQEHGSVSSALEATKSELQQLQHAHTQASATLSQLQPEHDKLQLEAAELRIKLKDTLASLQQTDEARVAAEVLLLPARPDTMAAVLNIFMCRPACPRSRSSTRC
jgi:chromosome segregation ATPase